MKFQILLLLALSAATARAGILEFFNGRPKDGFVLKPPPEVRERAELDTAIQTLWFKQPLDHFVSMNTRTWSQRYMTNLKYYKAGGPVFVMIGGESAIDKGWMNWGFWQEQAKIFGAAMYQVEHRFYGQSHPTPDVSTGNLRYLSSEQALGDLAGFVSSLRRQYRGQKLIVFGGSYPGNLAAWFRLKYPYLCDGSVASSAPVFAEADFYQYLEVVGRSLDYVAPGCSSLLQQAFQALSQMIQSGNLSGVKTLFNLCTPLNPADNYTIANFYQTIIGTWQGAVQYNNQGPYQIAPLCRAMNYTSLGSPLKRLAAIYHPELQCLYSNYKADVQYLKNTSWSVWTSQMIRQWLYQSCTEFGYFQSTDSRKQPFGAHVPLRMIETTVCQDVFGISPNTVATGVKQSNQIYGGKGLKATNIVLPNGSVDPWHALGILSNIGVTGKAIYITGTSHCFDMRASYSSDPPQVKSARRQIHSNLASWLLS